MLALKVTLGHHICELYACDHRVTSIILDVMVKPNGSTADEQEIDQLFWTYPRIYGHGPDTAVINALETLIT